MSYDNNENEYEPAAPKKADVLIKSTQSIVHKQEELSEQTKLAVSKIGEAIDLCNKNSQEANTILDRSMEMFDRLHEENVALKQELLYLAKQSENIYAGLAEKLNEMQSGAMHQQAANVPADYNELSQSLSDIYDRLADLSARIDALASDRSGDALNDKFAILYDKMDAVSADVARPVSVSAHANGDDIAAILDKLNRLTETMRKNEGAHSMLADKFEILSMRVEQFGFESAKSQPSYAQPAQVYPANVQPVSVQPAEIDYDKLAAKVAELLSVREAVSPDYIASKVAEQIVLPEQGAAEIDTSEIAKEVASLIDVKSAVLEAEAEKAPVEFDEDALAEKLAGRVSELVAQPLDEDALADRLTEKISVPVDIDEETLADKIAERLSVTATDEVAAVAAPVEIDEDALADKIAERLSVTTEDEVATGSVEFDSDALVEKIVSRISEMLSETVPANAQVNIDEEELADAIALKVGSLKPEDFEILVDDAGCASISKEIAEKLDYHVISSIVADKLREILDLNAANAPDYEDMAERISEKITVAGINEDAIADKAAAVLSNYLPEFDTEEIADKVTGAVIDVISAMPQPTLDSESICNEITERLIEKQEDNDYDIILDDDGISRITAIVTEGIEKDTDARFAKLEERFDKLTEMLTPEEEVEEAVADAEAEEEVEEADTISELVASEIEKGTAPRFDKVDQDIAKIYELVSNIVVEDGETEETSSEVETVEYEDADYSRLSEIVASEIEKGVTSRLDGVEEKITALTDMLTAEDTEEADEVEEVDESEEAEETLDEEEYSSITDIVSQMETNLLTRFDGVEEKITALTDMLTVEEEETDEETEEVEEEIEEPEDELSKLSDMVASRFDSVDEKLSSISEQLSASESEEYEEATEEDYNKLSEIVSSEVEKGVAARFENVEEDIRKISAVVAGIAVAGAAGGGQGNVDALVEQFDKISEDIKKISEYVGGEVPVIANERIDKIAYEVEKISQLVDGEMSVETNARLDALREELDNISKRLDSGVPVVAAVEEISAAQTAEAEEDEELVTVSDIVKPADNAEEEAEEDSDGDFLLSALDMDKFSDDERMPGELDLDGGVDFENMMKYNRSFIARIIQSDDDIKQYYGEVKHALLSYKKVNSNVAWGNERFNKGRETIARMKIRGKTLVIYLALDPNEYKTSVYHHADVSDNKSVLGTPMMIKVKSPLGARKAIRLIDEMLSKRNGEKREVPERDYAAMYPYETIEELIEDGLVKDVRNK